jgi:hypothetical protein
VSGGCGTRQPGAAPNLKRGVSLLSVNTLELGVSPSALTVPALVGAPAVSGGDGNCDCSAMMPVCRLLVPSCVLCLSYWLPSECAYYGHLASGNVSKSKSHNYGRHSAITSAH